MNILPSQYCSEEIPPTSAADLIGGAHDEAVKLEKIIKDSVERGFLPIKLLYSGEPGVGKTSLTLLLMQLLNVSKWAVRAYNGTDMTIDVVRDIGSSLHMTHNDLFGSYRVIIVNEADCIPTVAQVGWLSVMDNLPRRTAVVCTCNSKVDQLEKRFQTRFKAAQVRGAKPDEIISLLQRWPIPPAITNSIAKTACGNVRVALLEAEEWLQSQPAEKAA